MFAEGNPQVVSTNGEDGFGMFAMIILVLALMGGNGFGGGNASMAEISNDFMYTNLNTSLNALQNEVVGGFNGINNNITSLGYQTLLSQKELGTQIAMGNCSIENTIHNEAEATRALITTNTIQDLRDRLERAEFQNSQFAQNEYLIGKLQPMPVPAWQTSSPYAASNGNWYGCGC